MGSFSIWTFNQIIIELVVLMPHFFLNLKKKEEKKERKMFFLSILKPFRMSESKKILVNLWRHINNIPKLNVTVSHTILLLHFSAKIFTEM